MASFQDSVTALQLTFLAFLVSAFGGVYLFLRRNPRLKHHLTELGGPLSIPVIGNVLDFYRPHNEYIKMLEGWVQRYGSVFGFWIANFVPYVFVTDANVIEKLISSTNNLDKGKFEVVFLHDWLGTGLLTAPRKKWTHRRKLLLPSFHFKILEEFIPIFNEQSCILLECLERRNLNGTKDDAFNIYPYFMKYALDVICETAMGKKINAQTGTENRKYTDAVTGMCSLVMSKITKPWLRVPLIYHFSSVSKAEKECLQNMKEFTKQVIQSRKIERKTKMTPEILVNDSILNDDPPSEKLSGKRRKAFLDLLLDTSENGVDLSDADIQEEVDTFMFEGHDTTGVNLSWTVFLLASHPEIQKLVQEELDEIFKDEPTRHVTNSDLSKMKYLDCCMKESLRLYPSVPTITRQVDNDIPLENGKRIPQGATAIISIYFTHRDPKYFPDPNQFRPERFDAENSQFPKRHPFSYIPFSMGPRNCLGQRFALLELKIVLAKLFQMYDIEAVDKVNDISLIPDVVLRSENGINVILRKRK